MGMMQWSRLGAFAHRAVLHPRVAHKCPLGQAGIKNETILVNFCWNAHLYKQFRAGQFRLSSTAAVESQCLARASKNDVQHVIRSLTPLCERYPAYTFSLAEIRRCHAVLLDEVDEVDKGCVDSDAGPTRDDLATELQWLFDDAIACVWSSRLQQWENTSWRVLQTRQDLPRSATRVSSKLRISLDNLAALWQRRLRNREPLQYLVCGAHWRDVVLAVCPGVLIPRPETELLVDFALRAVQVDSALARGSWADLGTGSGALAVCLARELGRFVTGLDHGMASPPSPPVWAVDKSSTAVAVARRNAERLGVERSVSVVEGSWAQPLLARGLAQTFVGVVSNPPYIAPHVLPTLQAEVGAHEPRLALDGGSERGLAAPKAALEAAGALLTTGGFLAMEVGDGEQAEALAAHAQSTEMFCSIETRRDYAGIKRFLLARRTQRRMLQPSVLL